MIWACLCLTAGFMSAQLPTTNIYSFSYQLVDGQLSLSNGKMLSSFNSDGYNNQPSFVNGEIYLTSNRNEKGQTDIVALNPAKRSLYNVTHTPESEYSPTVMPDGKHFSVVRVELDGNDSQLLWKYPIDRSHAGEKILDLTNVGYFAWLDANMVAMFLVGDPHTLVLRNIRADHNKVIGTNVGRSIRTKNGNIVFVEKTPGKPWYIKVYNKNLEETTNLIQTLPQCEDFTMLRDGTLIMANKSVLYKYNGKVDDNWVKVADLRKYGLTSITRMQANANTLLLVN